MQPVEMALEAALLVMQNGGSTVAAERSFSNILKGYKKDGIEDLSGFSGRAYAARRYFLNGSVLSGDL
jgi:hypothetical protein